MRLADVRRIEATEIGTPESNLIRALNVIFAEFNRRPRPTMRQRQLLLADAIRAVHNYFAAKVYE